MKRLVVAVLSVALAACGGTVTTPGATGNACGAAGSADACQPVSLGKVANSGGLVDLKVDDANVYLADESGQVFTVPIGGGGGTVLMTVPAGYNAALTLALDDTDVYFAGGGTVGKVPKAGGAATTLVSGKMSGLGLAIAGSTLYWPESGIGSGTMLAVPKGGGAVQTLASTLDFPTWPVTDGAEIFFLASSAIDAIPAGGGAATTLVASGATAQQIALDAASVYWAEDDGMVGTCGICPPPPPPKATDSKVLAVARAGGSPTTLAAGYRIDSVAVDGTGVYWFDGYAKTLSVAPVAGGAPTVLATGVTGQLGPVVDAHAVYWVATTGEVMRMPKSPR